MYFGLNASDWQIIGIIGGLAIAIIGAIANLGINIYFKHKHLRLLQTRRSHFNSGWNND